MPSSVLATPISGFVGNLVAEETEKWGKLTRSDNIKPN